jgi:RNA polymerase sigma-70 factor (ECF subfamily)
LACKNKYGGYVNTILFNILRNREDAEECENDVWMAAWSTIPPARPQSLKNYLAGIARNKGINLYNYASAQKRAGGTEELLEEIASFTPSDDPSEELMAKELSGQINSFLKTLDEGTRVCFVLRYYYAHTNEEIAKKTGRSAHAVAALLSKTRGRLKDFLEDPQKKHERGT